MRIEQSEFHDHLVRGLAHKMNNILSLFHGYLGMLIDDNKLDGETMTGLLRIRDSADAATHLIDRTKAFANSTGSSHWRQIAPADLLRSLLPSLQLYGERGIQVEVDCATDLPILWADTSRLRVAIKEIVKNACEASPPGGIVKISVCPHQRPVRTAGRRPVAKPLSWMAITISDSGPGIPAELMKKVFQPFFSTKERNDSLGLGLSVALGLIQQVGGVIRLNSKPGRTMVKILLPSRTE